MVAPIDEDRLRPNGDIPVLNRLEIEWRSVRAELLRRRGKPKPRIAPHVGRVVAIPIVYHDKPETRAWDEILLTGRERLDLVHDPGDQRHVPDDREAGDGAVHRSHELARLVESRSLLDFPGHAEVRMPNGAQRVLEIIAGVDTHELIMPCDGLKSVHLL